MTIAADVRAEMERMRAAEGMGPSEALNTLARRGMLRSKAAPIAMPDPVSMGAKVDLSNIADVLDLLDDEGRGV